MNNSQISLHLVLYLVFVKCNQAADGDDAEEADEYRRMCQRQEI